MARFPVRSDDRRPWRYRLVAGFWKLLIRLWFGRKLHIEGFRERSVDTGVIVSCNHLSNLDPLVMGSFFPQTLFAMAKVELFRVGLVGWLLRGSNVFPVDRQHADRRALRIALELLAAKRRLMIFVEGTRAASPGMKRAEPGVGFLVRKSGAAVLPVAVWNTEKAWPRKAKFWRRTDIYVKAGDLIPNSEFSAPSDQEIADMVARKTAELLPVEYRGYYR